MRPCFHFTCSKAFLSFYLGAYPDKLRVSVYLIMTIHVHCSDTCNYFFYFLQKSTGNEIQMSSFCRVREDWDMRLSIQFMVALVVNRRKQWISRHCCFGHLQTVVMVYVSGSLIGFGFTLVKTANYIWCEVLSFWNELNLYDNAVEGKGSSM